MDIDINMYNAHIQLSVSVSLYRSTTHSNIVHTKIPV